MSHIGFSFLNLIAFLDTIISGNFQENRNVTVDSIANDLLTDQLISLKFQSFYCIRTVVARDDEN